MIFCNLSSSFKSQIIPAVCANIISFSHGIVAGWLSPVLELLKSEQTPLASGPLSVDQVSWIGSIVCLSSICGVIVYTILSDKLGRKFALNFFGITHVMFYLIILFGDKYYQLLIARLISGFGGGGIFVCIPYYIADIADPKIRGSLGSIFQLVYNIGILSAFIIGAAVSYKTYPLIGIIFPIAYTILIIFFPETPQSLIKRNKLKDAEISFKYYRGIEKRSTLSKEYQQEFQDMIAKLTNTANHKELKVVFKDFQNKTAIKGIGIGVALMIFNQFSGCFMMLNYAATIFHDAGSSLTPNMSAIILAVMQIAGSCVSYILIDKIGRKILLFISMTGITLGLTVCGLFSYFSIETNYDVSAFAIIPVISLSFVIFMACIGILSIPYVICAEIIPTKLRSHGSAFCMITLLITAFIILKFFPILSIVLELYGCLWLFASVSVFGIVFIAAFVPETKGKNLITQN